MSELVHEAAVIMAAGIITVFAFLILLIGAVKLIGLWFAGGAGSEAASRKRPSANANTQIAPNKLAAIGAAVRRYRDS
ncbi:Oxaloacetate decarboxylase, gamma chain [Pseudidiomarina planktonica]|uniref:Oxaloacetate decarboxylase, gamma chain n=1 Tax=Pseudidiomarina planktonica TaxID=1323738 RepID=A0A1Y6F580_9GAMM|nr:OadG family transporter subunit [Pseudidiomarina planktonica]RUO65026.1 hypothetical protein CWI77_00640 [Pseudidiomarina planktonica]SMQ68470.1 Oxaloacetate decarboxylase, gamma chain [Pseudidiomarina planktonica]